MATELKTGCLIVWFLLCGVTTSTGQSKLKNWRLGGSFNLTYWNIKPYSPVFSNPISFSRSFEALYRSHFIFGIELSVGVSQNRDTIRSSKEVLWNKKSLFFASGTRSYLGVRLGKREGMAHFSLLSGLHYRGFTHYYFKETPPPWFSVNFLNLSQTLCVDINWLKGSSLLNSKFGRFFQTFRLQSGFEFVLHGRLAHSTQKVVLPYFSVGIGGSNESF